VRNQAGVASRRPSALIEIARAAAKMVKMAK
jgi:hypothetical protein